MLDDPVRTLEIIGFGIVFAGALIGLIIGWTLVWLGLFKKETLGLSDD